MYTIDDHGRMLLDKGRTEAYAKALRARITQHSTVLEIGTGMGVFALLACRFGARKVYSIESDDVIHLAREIAAANGLSERIQFIQGFSSDVGLPEKVDGIVSDIHGVLPPWKKSLLSIIDARDRFLKPGGWLIPKQETLWAAIVNAPELHGQFVGMWGTYGEFGLDFSVARERAGNLWRRASFTPNQLVVEPLCWATLDYATLSDHNIQGMAHWTTAKPGLAHGIGVWFESSTSDGMGFSNSPKSTDQHVYGQGFLPWPSPIELAAGDQISVSLRADLAGEDYIWGWESRVVAGEGSGEVKASFHQSDLRSAISGPENLRKRADRHVPRLSKEGAIDRVILHHMSVGLSVGEIAHRIVAEFPDCFRNWYAALSRVGNLSEKYSA